MWGDHYGSPSSAGAHNAAHYWGQWESHYGPMQRRPTSRRHQMDAMFGPTSGYVRPPALLPQPAPYVPFASAVQPKLSAGIEKMQKAGQLYYDFNAPVKPNALSIKCAVQSIRCDFQWNAPRVNKGINFTYKIKISGCPTGDITMEYASWKTSATVDLEPGNRYKIYIEAISNGTVLAAGDISFKSILCAAEMASLQMKAINFLQTCHGINQMQEIIIFYRNKPPEYWKKIQTHDSVMRPYLKDQCGNPGSPINGEINGLFFAARLHNGMLPTSSPFGGQRLKLYCQKLFLPETHHMYFGDFYCNTYVHYVTVVICHKNSPVDQFCRDKLDLLNPFDNLFLKLTVDSYGNYRYFINNNVWVEVYFTGDVPLWWGEFDYTVSLGQSKPNGIPNNKFCTVCNLYPLETPPADRAASGGKLPAGQQLKRIWEEVLEDRNETYKKPRVNWIDIELILDPSQSGDVNVSGGNMASTSTFHLAMQSARQLSDQSNSELDEFLPHAVEVSRYLVDAVTAEQHAVRPFKETPNVAKFSFPPPNPPLLTSRDELALIERIMCVYGPESVKSDDDHKGAAPNKQKSPTSTIDVTQPKIDLTSMNVRAQEMETKVKKLNDTLHPLKILVRTLEKKLAAFQ